MIHFTRTYNSSPEIKHIYVRTRYVVDLQVENYADGQTVAKENLAVACFCLNDILGKFAISSFLIFKFSKDRLLLY